MLLCKIPNLALCLMIVLAACAGGGADEFEEQGDAQTTVDVTVDAMPLRSRMFVTSATFSGDVGGIAGADAICLGAAASAELGGDWRAWISTPQTNAIDHITDAAPWYLVDRETLVFPSHAALRGSALVPIGQNEFGPFRWQDMGLGERVVKTGSRAGVADDTCQGFTSSSEEEYGTYGWLDEPDDWGGSLSGRCSSSNGRLYCFEQHAE